VYSYSFELNPDWSHSFSGGAEIWAYCERCVEKYELGPHLRFNSEVLDARFEEGRWHVTTRDGKSIVADVLVSGLGGLHIPNHAAIAGKEDFRGTLFHSAQWNHAHDLKGRHVAMIGTGAKRGTGFTANRARCRKRDGVSALGLGYFRVWRTTSRPAGAVPAFPF
jgi:cation diffusion facilitator CzcD-associated flavoprotein CzcO